MRTTAISAQKCESIGLKVKHLEDDQELQDKVLLVHHIYFHTLSSTPAFKIIENHDGKAFILQAQQMLFNKAAPAAQGGILASVKRYLQSIQIAPKPSAPADARPSASLRLRAG